MLKITERRLEERDSVLLMLEGRLVGPWVTEVEGYWRQLAGRRRHGAEIDLSGVSYVDAEGKALLKRMWREGAVLRAAGCLMRCLVDEITGMGKAESPCLHGEKRTG